MGWKWTQKSAVVSARNPKSDATLYLEYDARPDLFTTPQRVTIMAGDQVVYISEANVSAPTLIRIPVTAAQLGTGEMVDFRIDLDQTFVPAKMPSGGRDTRELGIRVYHFFVEPK